MQMDGNSIEDFVYEILFWLILKLKRVIYGNYDMESDV